MGLFEERKMGIIALNSVGNDGWDGAIVDNAEH